MTAITGNTYPVKEKLKALGARWNGDAKAWMVPDDKATEAAAIVAAAPAEIPGAARPAFRHYKCKQCGCAASRYNPIYRSGVCRDCYKSDKEEADMGY